MFDAQHAALQGEEFAVGGGAADVREAFVVAELQGAGQGCVVRAGGRVQVGHGVGVDGGPAGVDFIFAPGVGVHWGGS